MALPVAERAKLLEVVFGPNGARANILRSEVSWTGKRLPLTHPLYLRGFMYYFAEDEHETAQFNLFREAQKLSDILWNSCVWTPPPQWKSNQSASGGELLAKHYEDFATYLAAYVEFYKKLRFHDIPVLSLQNAPSVANSNRSCVWSVEAFSELLKTVGKKFAERAISTKIMLPEVGWDELATYVQPLLAAETKGLLSYLSAHSIGTNPDARTFAKELSKKNNLKLWQTEFALPDEPGTSDMSRGLRLAEQMVSDLVQAESNAWIYWTPLQPTGWTGRLGLLDRSASGFQTTKRFWSFAQFSRFLPRNSVRISANGGAVPLVAFRNPEYSGIVLIFINATQQPSTETLQLKGWSLERMRAYRTSESEDLASLPLPAESGSTMTLALQPLSITTLVAQIRRVG
jgi:O-glycosyl hydrolase